MPKVIKPKNLGFEVYESNINGVTFKRVVARKGRKNKEKFKIELAMPKVTMAYFSDDDLTNLREIENEISGNINTPHLSRLQGLVLGIKGIFVE